MADRICSHEGCGRKGVARGLCAPHYSTWHRTQLKYTITCHCGKTARVARKRTKYCSPMCGMNAVNAGKAGMPVNEWLARPNAQEDTRRSRRLKRFQNKLDKAAAGTRGRTIWMDRSCKMCGARFITQSASTGNCCSPDCTKANRRSKAIDAGQRRRALKRGAYVQSVRRLAIFKRDKYRCHICKNLTNPRKCAPHPKSPTIDHIIPLAKGGTHEPANVATACFACNCLKRDQGGGEQLALIG